MRSGSLRWWIERVKPFARRSAPASNTVHDFDVRAATVADLSTVVELRIALLREHAESPVYGRLRTDAEQRAQRLFATQLTSQNEITYLAFAGDEANAVGILRCIETAGSPLLLPEKYAYISSVYVRPEHRREGVLKLLLARAEEWSRSRGLAEMRLHNVSDYATAGVAWQALGFEVVEQLRIRPLSNG